MRIISPLFVLVCALAGCGGGGNSAGTPVTQISGAAAYLIWPGSAPYAAPIEPMTLVFAQHGLNSSYTVTVTPSGSGSPLPFTLNLNPVPSSLPSPLATPPSDPIPVSLAAAIGNVNAFYGPTTQYSVTLVGCPHPNADGSCPSALQTIVAGNFQTGCGLPPPIPYSFAYLAYPSPGATGVPDAIGRIIVGGYFLTGTSATFALASSAGPVPLGSPVPAVSPLPSPLATGPNGNAAPDFQLSVSTLAAATQYSVSYSQTEWANTPPACSTLATQTLGTFTTQ